MDDVTQPKTEWLDFDFSANTLSVLADAESDLPTTDETYSLRVTYKIDESMYGEEGYFYDVFSLSVDIDSDCQAFKWSDTTATGPVDFSYDFAPLYYDAAVQFIQLP